MNMKKLSTIFQSSKTVLIKVVETEEGIITYFHPLMSKMNSAYKKQLIEFLEGCKQCLK